MSKVKKYLAALAAVVGVAAAYGLGSADVLAKVAQAISAGQAAVEVLEPSASPAPEAPAVP